MANIIGRIGAAWNAFINPNIPNILGLDKTRLASTQQILGYMIYEDYSCFDDYIRKAQQANDAVYSVTTWIANKVCEAPISLYQKKKGKEKEFEMFKRLHKSKDLKDRIKAKAMSDSGDVIEIKDHPLLDMLNTSPNPNMSGNTFLTAIVLNLLLTGNAYVLGVSPDTAPNKFIENYPFPPKFTHPIASGYLGDVSGYRFDFTPGSVIPKEEMCHIKLFNPNFETNNPYVIGMSPLQAAANAVRSYNSGSLAETKAFDNGGSVGILYEDSDGTKPPKATDEQMQTMQRMINQKVKGAENYKSIYASNSKLGWLQIGESPVDLNIVEAGLNSLRKICNVFHVPSELFNDPEGSTYNNMQDSRKAGLTDAVFPMQTLIEDAFNPFYIPGWFGDNSGFYLAFDRSVYPELRQDMGATATALSVAWWLTPNEKRVQMDYETLPEPNMDAILTPAGLSPISDAGMNLDLMNNNAIDNLDKAGIDDYRQK
jgi:HK97 family phage portal protein